MSRRFRNAKKQTSLDESLLERITDFFFETGMLRHTPRSGWAFLGHGAENVADHSFRVAAMSFTLAKLAGLDPFKACAMGLFHDLHEARTGDLNYENQRYAKVDHRKAQEDALDGTGIKEEVLRLFDEFETRETKTAQLVKDADQLDLVFNLKAELDKGLDFAREWLASAILRLRTDEARALAETMMHVDHNRWWYGRVDRRWWVDREKKYKEEQAGLGARGANSYGWWKPEVKPARLRPRPKRKASLSPQAGSRRNKPSMSILKAKKR